MRIVFHAPFPLNRNAVSASGIRPVKMYDALRSLGHEVWLVDGHTGARARKIRAVRDALARGVGFDACYAESSTMPTPLTDPDHLPRRPGMDYRFFAALRRAGTPVGVFYRDIQWQFPMYNAVKQPMRMVARAFYRAELMAYRRVTDVVFLPSEKMGSYLGKGFRFAALPPGHNVAEPVSVAANPLRLFYVGGIGNQYQLKECVEGVTHAYRAGVDVRMTICARPAEWRANEAKYADVMSPAIEITEGYGARLHELFGQANIAILALTPMDYLTFAVPVKLYEYLGEGKPIIATTGTLSGDIVRGMDVGWSVAATPEAVRDLLVRLAAHPDEVDAAHQRVMTERVNHTWIARATQMLHTLTSGAAGPQRTRRHYTVSHRASPGPR